MESYPHVHDLLVISMAIFAGCHWPHRKPRKKPGKAAPCSSLRSDKGSSKSWRSSDWDEGNPGQMPGRSTDHWWISPYFTIICNPGNPARFFRDTLRACFSWDPGWSDPPSSQDRQGSNPVEIPQSSCWNLNLVLVISTATLRDFNSYFAGFLLCYSCSFDDHLKMFEEAIESYTARCDDVSSLCWGAAYGALFFNFSRCMVRPPTGNLSSWVYWWIAAK